MSISLVNRTNKTIVFGGIIFHFWTPETARLCLVSEQSSTSVKGLPSDAYDGRTGQPLNPEYPVTAVTKINLYRGSFTLMTE
jgi:hypothetical protein